MPKKKFYLPDHHPKGGDPADINNYRPISKYCAFAKMMDCLVYNKISIYVNKYIINIQHGFLPGRSTCTDLVVYIDDIMSSLNKGLSVYAVYTDLTRAFDTVNICFLLRKLEGIGINGMQLKWFASYLTDRKHTVKVKEILSELIFVLSGVGQGSHLVPILFLIFINDVHFVNKFSKFLLFADDKKIYKAIKSLSNVDELQSDINAFND